MKIVGLLMILNLMILISQKSNLNCKKLIKNAELLKIVRTTELFTAEGGCSVIFNQFLMFKMSKNMLKLTI